MAPPAKEAAALLALGVCWDVLGEKERLCLEPSASYCKGWPCLTGKDQTKHSYKLAPLQQNTMLAFFTDFRKLHQNQGSFKFCL